MINNISRSWLVWGGAGAAGLDRDSSTLGWAYGRHTRTTDYI